MKSILQNLSLSDVDIQVQLHKIYNKKLKVHETKKMKSMIKF